MSFQTVSERLAAMEDALRELVQALGPCGSFDKKGNCRNHFATCPCPVEEADLLLAKMRESAQEPERINSSTIDKWEWFRSNIVTIEKEYIDLLKRYGEIKAHKQAYECSIKVDAIRFVIDMMPD